MRTCDIDTAGAVWCYAPPAHKTEHHGHARNIWIGPRGQGVLRSFLRADTRAYVFSPAEAEAGWRARKRSARRSKLSPSQLARSEAARRRERTRPPGDRYDVCSYRRAIARACDAAFPPPEPLRPAVDGRGRREGRGAFLSRLTPAQKAELAEWRSSHRWHPHQLRHSAAARLRKEHGIEVARVILGHRSAAVTELYAEMDADKPRQIMASAG